MAGHTSTMYSGPSGHDHSRCGNIRNQLYESKNKFLRPIQVNISMGRILHCKPSFLPGAHKPPKKTATGANYLIGPGLFGIFSSIVTSTGLSKLLHELQNAPAPGTLHEANHVRHRIAFAVCSVLEICMAAADIAIAAVVACRVSDAAVLVVPMAFAIIAG